MTTSSSNAARDAATGDTDQDFRTKYVKTNAITRKLLAGFFNGIGELLREPGLNEVRSAIEVGCGEGFSTQKLRELLPREANFRASDVEQRLVDEARLKNPGVTMERESIYQLPHADKSFDLVFTASCEGAPACIGTITYVSVAPGTHDSAEIPGVLREALQD